MDNNSLIPSTKLSPDQGFPKPLPRSRCAKCSSCAIHANLLKMQVCLYNWSLIRVDGDHPDNDNIGNGKLVTLEGYTTSDFNDHDKFRTAPIETRIGKLKLKTVDGMTIFLKSMIDEQRSFENGFPLPVIHLFLTGFPLNWNNVLNIAFGQPSSNGSVLQASKDESVWQEKNGIQSLREEDENINKVEEKLPKVTSGESLTRGRKMGRNGSQHIRSSKRLKCGNLSINKKPKVSTLSGKDMTKDQMYLCTEDYRNFERDDHLVESHRKLLRRKSLNFSVSHEDRDSVKCKEHTVYDVLTSMKIKSETEQSPLDSVHLQHLENNCTPGGEQTDETQMPLSELGKLMPLDSPVAKRNRMKKSVRLEIIDEAGKKTLDVEHEIHSDNIIIPLDSPVAKRNRMKKSARLEITDEAGKKTLDVEHEIHSDNIIIPLDSPVAKRNRMRKSVRLEITDEAGKKTLDVEHEIHSDNIICRRASAKNCKKNILSPSVSGFTAIPYETCLSSPAENNLFPLPENHLKSNVTKRVKHVNKLGTKNRERSQPRTRCTGQSPQLSDEFVCHETNLNDNLMSKSNDICAACITTSDKGPNTIEHVTASDNRSEIDENSQKANDNGEASWQTPQTRIEINMQTKTKKRQNIPLTPRHRVHTTPEEVSKAFGLKTSRSGRLLVPPLAHWCNQTIAYDMDGGIIAILDASSQRDKNYGSSIFTPPAQKVAISIRKKLCDAANGSNLTLPSSKKSSKK